jgi:hypothetical protein
MPAVTPMTDVHIASVFNHMEPDEYFGVEIATDDNGAPLFTDDDYTERY